MNDKLGRLVKIQEILRITDEGGSFYFQYPPFIKVAADGTIFVYDQDELLRFDQNGKFLHNYYKKGQGPGELNYVRNYTFQDDRLIVHSANPNKIVWFNFDGTLIKDQKIFDVPGSIKFQLLKNSTYYFWKFEFPARTGKPTTVDIPQVLVAVDQDGKVIEDLVSFPIKSYVMGGALVQYSTMRSVPYKNRHIFITHTREYSVKLFDTQSKKVLRTFNRAYKRVKTPKDHQGAAIVFEGKRYGPEQEKYLNDINNLFIFNELLWVVTSTKDKENRPLIDVFDFDGRYLDSFYLDVTGTLIATHRNMLFVREKEEDELIHLVIYEVID
ncbi:MAG: 6-bladed beta-propeller [Candidatus Aminicenantes bacterium]|nr:MAG: 6-bladed beta-propeller [Candidatus Aminicenantes bacterium]